MISGYKVLPLVSNSLFDKFLIISENCIQNGHLITVIGKKNIAGTIKVETMKELTT